MENKHLCEYCENDLEPGATQCVICLAEVPPNAHNILKSMATNNDEIGITEPTELEAVSLLETNLQKGEVSKTTESEDNNGIDKPIEIPLTVKEDTITTVDKSAESSSWTCVACTFINKADLVCCVVCFSNKVSNETKKNEELGWACTECGLENELINQCCGACNKSKVINGSSDMLTEAKVEDVGENRWDCVQCSYTNYVPALQCFVCEAFNKSLARCGQCGRAVFTNDNVCKNCHKERRDEYGRSLSYDAANSIAYEENNCELLTQSANYLGSSKHQPQSRRRATIQVFFGRLRMFGKNKRWLCRNGTCGKENRSKLENCKRCGAGKNQANALDNITEDGNQGNDFVNENDTVKRKESQTRKRWRCGNEECRRKNGRSRNRCLSCGRLRDMNNIDLADRRGSEKKEHLGSGLQCFARQDSRL